MKIRIVFFCCLIFLILIGHTKKGLAMNVLPPDEFKVSSKDGKYQFFYKVKETPWVVKKDQPGVKMLWTGIVPYVPSEAQIAPEANLMYFLGGVGDAGTDLGKITIRDLTTGKEIARTDLMDLLPNLEDVSAKYTPFGNFMWIASAKLSKNGEEIHINVCKKWNVKVTGKTGKAEILSEIKK